MSRNLAKVTDPPGGPRNIETVGFTHRFALRDFDRDECTTTTITNTITSTLEPNKSVAPG